MPRNRHDNALLIQQGACNPAGIARSLVEACDECLKEGVSQREDAAVRLIVHQLAHLMAVSQIDASLTEYSRLTDECRANAENKERV
jgi:hypothetical protein